MPDLGPQFAQQDTPLPGTDNTHPLDYLRHAQRIPPVVEEHVQHARYSGMMNPDDLDWHNPVLPLPASMERHAPGEYQPTLPGMEKMLKGEMSHVNTVFKRPTVGYENGDVKGSNMGYHFENKTQPKYGTVDNQRLAPSQEWLDDNYLHSPPDKLTMSHRQGTAGFEHIEGVGPVITDGHHRLARDILSGVKRSRVHRWEM